MDVKELNFKEYLENKKKMDEELQMQQQKSEAEQSLQTQAMNCSVESLIVRYVGRSDLKAGLAQLGQDLGNAIVNYALNTFVTDDMFDSQDAKAKYQNIVNQKIQLQAVGSLVDILKHIGIDLQNTKTALTI